MKQTSSPTHRREERPGVGLRETSLEPFRLCGKALELAENHLLASLRRDRLEEDLRSRPRVELAEEAVHACDMQVRQQRSSEGTRE